MNAFDAMGEWGYCKPCGLLVLLERDGRFPVHNGSIIGGSAECRGSGRYPWPEPKELTAEEERRLTGIDPQ